MKREEFESFLDEVVARLREDVHNCRDYHEAQNFERRVLTVMQDIAHKKGLRINPTNHPHAFPDIKANGFGVEVKSTRQDSWDATANSIMESMRDKDAERVYVVFGKMGGETGVKWRRYEDAVRHVRISHAPRFVVGMDTPEGDSLFAKIGMTYEEFAKQNPSEKMARVREYARSRLQPGERLWWLEDQHTVDLRVRRFSKLNDEEKRQMRAETAVLCPEIVSPGRQHQHNKYDAALHFLLTYRGILASRDMFTAGSVGAPDGRRGGEYMLHGLLAVQSEMAAAFRYLDQRLFEEYWPSNTKIPADAEGRQRQWLVIADEMAQDAWVPSEVLFKS